jgi:hypothetical protein
VEVDMTDMLAATALVVLCAVFWWVGIHIGAHPNHPTRKRRVVPFEGDP